jgi:hypothetical protein
MTRVKSPLQRDRSEPLYGKAWHWMKQFPGGLAKGSDHPPTVSGPAAAAFISAGIGCLTMMVIHHFSDTNKSFEASVLRLGSWMPGATNPDPVWGNIGSYAGKETTLLIGWLVSWAILHSVLKHRQVKGKTILVWMFALMMAATAMCWHPLFPYMPLT